MARREGGHWLWLAPLAVVLVAAAILSLDRSTGLRPLVQLWSEASALQRDVAALEAERDALRARAIALKSDPLEIEALARERLGMVREGEVVIRVSEPRR